MKIKISATFEGKCSLCGKEKIVFTAGDDDTKKVVTICKECTSKLEDMKTSEVIKKFGKKDPKVFEEGFKIEKTNKE
jgi:transcription elongation factor Elf1